MGEKCYNCFRDKPDSGACPACGYNPQDDAGKYPFALPAGSILKGEYVVGRVLGQGGFGITYIAQEHGSGKRIAIKEYLPGELAARTGTYGVTAFSGDRLNDFNYGKEQFLNEARTLAEFIGNVNIVDVYSFFEENNTAYFSMEYVDGPSLESRVKKSGLLSVEEACELLLPLIRSIGEVHAKGIIHRDIAPDNILIASDGTAKLIDFGAARYSMGEKSRSLDVVLKHGFAPKEQYSRHGRQGAYTDVYAMAATFYYAITGRIPPDSVDRMEEDHLILPSSLGVNISRKVEDALEKALSVYPSDRFQSMDEFADAMPQPSADSLILKGNALLAAKSWDTADSCFRKALKIEPENAQAYIGRLMAELGVEKLPFLAHCKNSFRENENYKKAIEYADVEIRTRLETLLDLVESNQRMVSVQDSVVEHDSDSVSDSKTDDIRDDPPNPPKNRLIMLIAGIAAVVLVVCICIFAFGGKPTTTRELDDTHVVVDEYVEPELIFRTQGLKIEAKNDNDYNFARLDVELEPNQAYTVVFDEFTVKEGFTPGLGIRLYDFAKDAKLKNVDSALIDTSIKKSSYRCVLETPAEISDEIALLVYAGVHGKTAGVGVEYKNVSIYKGIFKEDKKIPTKTELVYTCNELIIPAKQDSDYNHTRLNFKLKPSTTYTIVFADVEVTDGQTTGVGVKLYDFSEEAQDKYNTIFSAMVDISDGKGNYCCTFRTPAELDEDVSIVLYSGIHSKTKGVGVTYKGISLYEGVYVS